MYTKAVVIITILLSFCCAQETAEDWFIQARGYEMGGQYSLALKAYEQAYKKDLSSAFLENVLLIRYLRANQFEKALGISKEIRVGLNEYRDGNKVAEYYCYLQKTSQADSLWQQLIYNAVGAHQLDSALILANSFVQNRPNAISKTILSYLVVK
jgi:tetratricopeptide (TPR) repeat protein